MKHNRDTIRQIFRFLKKYRWYLAASILSAAATVIFQLTVPVLSGRAVDYLIGKGQVDFSRLLRAILQMGTAIGMAALFQLVMNLLNNHVAYRVVQDLRNQLFHRMQHLPLKYLDQQETGDLVSRMTSDADQFSDGLLMGFTQLFTGIITILGTIVFMLRVNVGISVAVILLTPLSVLVTAFVSGKTYHMFLNQSEQRGKLTGLVDEMVGSEKTVQAFSYEDRAKKRFDSLNRELTDSSMKATFYSSLTNPSTRLINNIVYAVVGVFGALSCLQGRMSVGQLTAFLSYATQYAKPINEISGVITEMQNAVACAARCFRLLEEPVEVETFEKPADFPSANEAKQEGKGSVDLCHVSFSYRKDHPLIQNLNVTVRPGMHVAIVGPTGCGKSTLINLLMRFYDVDQGTIRLDGQDIQTMSRHDLRSHYGMVLQDTWLKTGTVRENISFACPDADLEDVKKAARRTEADSFIRRLPEGYDTVLSEDGGGLSQGQKQLLCITRVMMRLPEILILDEATSSIDTRTEQKVQKAFSDMMEGRTSFVVAHRLSTIQSADLILVMKDGNILEQGNHQQLLNQHGFYEKLYMSQFEPES